MKKILIVLVVILSLPVYSQKGNIQVELISYRVPIRYSIDMQDDPSALDAYSIYGELFDDWYKNKLEPAEYELFTNGVHNAAVTGKIKVYDPFLTNVKGTKVNFVELSVDEVKSIGTSCDTISMSTPYPPYDNVDTVFCRVFDPSSIVAVDFLESWTINSATMKMTKKIIAFAPIMSIYSQNTGELMGMMPLYWVKM